MDVWYITRIFECVYFERGNVTRMTSNHIHCLVYIYVQLVRFQVKPITTIVDAMKVTLYCTDNNFQKSDYVEFCEESGKKSFGRATFLQQAFLSRKNTCNIHGRGLLPALVSLSCEVSLLNWSREFITAYSDIWQCLLHELSIITLCCRY